MSEYNISDHNIKTESSISPGTFMLGHIKSPILYRLFSVFLYLGLY